MRHFLTLAPNSNQSGHARLFLKMGPLYGTVPDSKTAQSLIDDVLKVDPNFVPALMARAALLAKGGNRNARSRFTRPCCTASPISLQRKASRTPYEQTAEARGGAYDLALKVRETLREDPELAQLLAKLSYERNEYAHAVQLLQQSATRGTLDAEGLYSLGMSHLNEKNTPRARAGSR